MRRMAREAARKPGALNNFLTKRLNVWTNQQIRWVNLDDWKKSPPAAAESELLGAPCFSALDLSSNTDLTALVHWFEVPDGTFSVLPRFWIPAERIADRDHRDAAQYEKWVRAGLIKATAGNVIDYAVVEADIQADLDRFEVRKLAYDPWGPAEAIRQHLLAAGMNEELMVQFRQGFASMSPAMKHLERLYLAQKIAGLNHPVLRWMVGNLQARMDPAGNVKPDKAASRKRIDGIVCVIMDAGLAMTTEQKPASVYNERGIRTL
jgi:phage terminase large subunit-like protein